ncbi:MAG: GntR family transcriptional regulator [Alphaproteobacteria bacterium]|nr:GntR family transcriptional regulator [Alphaproteobacteria bacterium]
MTVTTDGEVPVYLKLRGLIAARILEGRYPEGGQLPSVRIFAAENTVNPLTIAKAYQCLQDEGYIDVRRGVGMFVAVGATDRLRVQERQRFLSHIWPKMRAHIARLGISSEELLEREHI